MDTSGLFENNGIDQNYISNMKPGNKIVIVEKKSKSNILDDWQEPREFTLKIVGETTLHNSADYNETYPAEVLIGECGTELVIDSSMGIPIVDGYDIYLNYQSYFRIHGKIVSNVISRVKKEVKYINMYQSFKKKIVEEKPEKLI